MNKILDISVSTPPAVELITNTVVKARLKVEHTDEDDLIEELITETRSLIESACMISIGEQTRIVIGDLCEEYKLPYAPVGDVTAVELKNGDDYEASTGYSVDGVLFKSFIPDSPGRYKITYECGYDADNLPPGLKNAWLELIAYCYENRGDVAVPAHIKKKLLQYTRKYGV